MKFSIPWLLLLAAGLVLPASGLDAQTIPTDRISVISSLALEPGNPGNLFLATRYGLVRAEPAGMASLIPGIQAALTSLAAHPDDPLRFLASGYGANGAKLGVMSSADGGRSWTTIAEGVDGPAALHALDISRSDPDVVYGVSDGLQVSRDGGFTWSAVGEPPAEIFDLAISSKDSDTLYVATRGGLYFSDDGGVNWQSAHPSREPATMIYSTSGGRLYAFILGAGLIAAEERDLTWSVRFSDVTDRHLLNMVADRTDPDRLYVTVDTGAIMTSGDGGYTWTSFEGSHTASADRITKGEQLFEETCQSCHGEFGIGETPDDPSARDEFGFKAPALNDDTHAWHHSDTNLMNTIRNGSSRNERMVAFKDILSSEDIENVVAYVKSLWDFRALACQGARHMACMGQ